MSGTVPVDAFCSRKCLIMPPFTLKIIVVWLMHCGAAPPAGNSEMAVCASAPWTHCSSPPPSPLRGGEGIRGQPAPHTRSQASPSRSSDCLRYTAGLSAGSHPQSRRPLGWPSSSCDLRAKPRHSGTGHPVSRRPSIGKADIL